MCVLSLLSLSGRDDLDYKATGRKVCSSKRGDVGYVQVDETAAYADCDIIHNYCRIERYKLKVLNQFDFLLVSFQINFAKNQTYLVSTAT